MSGIRNATLGVLMAAVVALPAYAERSISSEATGDPSLNLSYTLMVIQPNGMTTMTHVDKATAGALMQHAAPLSGTMIVMTSGGKSWAVQDAKMRNGEMISQFLTRTQKLP